jgi:hypothetical protein
MKVPLPSGSDRANRKPANFAAKPQPLGRRTFKRGPKPVDSGRATSRR